jgi:hypothetical protein
MARCGFLIVGILGSFLLFGPLPVASLLSGPAGPPKEAISVGVAAVDITPNYPVRLSGFGFRKTESEGVTQHIFAKALAIGDEGNSKGTRLELQPCRFSYFRQNGERRTSSFRGPAGHNDLSRFNGSSAPPASEQSVRRHKEQRRGGLNDRPTYRVAARPDR